MGNGGINMFCGKCGTEYEEGALFCPKCGNGLQKNVNISMQDMENKPAKQKKRGKKWLIPVLVIFFVLGGTGVLLWQNGILNEGNGDITRGYSASTTAEKIIKEEKKRKDTTLIAGYMPKEKKWNEEKGIFEYLPALETDNVEEMLYIDYEGGTLLGMKAVSTRFVFSTDERELSSIAYVFLSSDYDKVVDKISKKFEDYRIVNEFGEYWSMGDYTVRIKEWDEEKFAVSVNFVE